MVMNDATQDPSSADWARRALDVLPRGVSSGARLRSVSPLFDGGSGAVLHAVDGTTYLDMIMASGPLLLGHDRPEIVRAVREQLDRGVLYGNHPAEVEVAEQVLDLLPHFGKVAFVNSGSEANHLAIRIARTTTGRPLVVKFEGHYHGWIDPLFLNNQFTPADEDRSRLPRPRHSVAGLAPDANVIVCRYGETSEIERVFSTHGADIAAVIAEPIPMNFGTFLPDPAYISRLRELCTSHGSVLIFDEVLSGFRLDLRGTAGLLDVVPDIAVYAKALASGFSLAAVVGSDAAMASIAHGDVTPAGTYNGNPVAIAAARATLSILEAEQDRLYPLLGALGERLAEGIRGIAARRRVPLGVNQIGSVLQMYWGPGEVRDFATAMRSERGIIADLCEAAMDDRIFIAPRGLMLLSAAHTVDDIDRAILALDAAVARLGVGEAGDPSRER